MKKRNSNTEDTATAEVEKESYLMIDPALIVVQDGFNVRQDFGNIEELMNSILENGIKRPLHGFEKDGKYVLTDGERRFRAVQLALEKGKKIEKVPFMPEPRTVNEEDRTLGLMLYNDGKPLNMLEQSEVIKRLLNLGWKITTIVKRTGKGRGYIENLILLIKAPMKVQDYIKEDKISAHAVIQLMQALKGDPEQLVAEVEEAIKTAEKAGKKKATPKHVKQKEVKATGYGKFYKWASEVADTLMETKEADKGKKQVILDFIKAFEDQKPVYDFVHAYFVGKQNGKKKSKK